MSFRRPHVALACASTLLFAATCARSPDGEAPAEPGSPGPASEGARLLAGLRAAFPSLEESAAAGFHPEGDGLAPDLRADVGPPPAGARSRMEVLFAGRGGEPTRVVERTSGLAFSVRLLGAAPRAFEPADGFLVLSDALPAQPGSALVARALPQGVEELVYLPTAPRGGARLAWELDLGNVTALRLYAGVLELIGADGRPAARMHRPWVQGADGVRHDAEVSVEGCAVDTEPSPPWGRSLPPPGAERCTISVDWSRAPVAYPALVDPVWAPTGLGLAFGRLGHTATSIDATGEVLIAGGYDPATGAALDTTEFYSFCTDPCQPSFSMGPTLAEPRGGHTETYLPASQRVLLVGGRTVRGGGAIKTSSELVDCSSGTCSVVTVAGAGARFQHTATRLQTSDAVLVAGGSGTNPSTAVLFDPATSSFGAPFNLLTRREAHAAELILDGSDRVLVAGGVGPSFVLATAEIFSLPGSFSAVPGNMTSPRAFASAARLEDPTGRILIAGGTNQATLTIPGIFSKTADIYDPATNSFLQQAKQMVSARAGHTATKLSGEGKVLLAGGVNNPVAEPDNLTGSTNTTDFFDASVPGGAFLFSDVPLGAKRSEHAAVRLTLGPVLVTGGAGKVVNSTTAAQAELLLRSPGDKCDADGECSTGFCANTANGKVCCNEPCSGICRTCANDGLATPGTCHDEVAGAPQSSLCAVVGEQEASIVLVCNGMGGVQSSSATDCQAFRCNANTSTCLAACTSDADCIDIGYCDPFGKCKFKPDKGEACSAGTQCLNDLPCVDGVCCNSTCAGQCEACDVLGSEGECTQVEGEQPHGTRPECTGAGTSCGGTCGSSNDACDYPTSTCGALTCAAGQSSAAKCDLGECKTTETPCAPFLCQNSSSCATSCNTSDDCVANHVCVEGDCKEVVSALCDPETNEIVSPGGQTVTCGAYRCSVSTNECFGTCTSIDQCAPGFVCDTAGTCVAPPEVPAVTDGCSAGGGGPSRRAAPLALLALGLALARRRSGAKGGRS